jgi:phosphatidylglycerol:prolipoprotein diacylglycerol transferase
MYPKLLDINLGFITIPINSYGFMIMLGFIISILVATSRGKKLGISSDAVMDVAIFSMIAGIVGSKLAYVIRFHHEYDLGIFEFWDGGMDYFGAIVFGILPYLYLWWHSRRVQLKLTLKILSLLIPLTLVFAIVGARLFYLIQYHQHYNWNVIKTWNMGFIFYGGLIGGIIVGVLILRYKRISVPKFADLSAPCIMLGLSLGRIGCFLNGCCYGKTSSLPWAISFPQGSLPQNAFPSELGTSLPVHPTQLYESLAALGLFLLLSWTGTKKKIDGEVLAGLGIGYSIWRFCIEFIRGDNPRIWFGTFTDSQMLSILIFLVCVVWFILLRRQARVRQCHAT